MATAAQVLANRANTQHSTGPRTPEGKARCSHNALRHGLTASRLVVRPDEREEFETLHADLAAELAPQGAVETLVFNELLHAAWNLHRYRSLEAEHAGQALAAGDDEAAARYLDRLGRYQARAQRAFYRALREFRTLQTDRALRALKLTEEEDETVPPAAAINELTKQSQSEVTAKALAMALKMVNYESGAFRLAHLHNRAAGPSPALETARRDRPESP